MHSGVMSLIFVLQEGFWKRVDPSARCCFCLGRLCLHTAGCQLGFVISAECICDVGNFKICQHYMTGVENFHWQLNFTNYVISTAIHRPSFRSCILKNCRERLYADYTVFAPVWSSLGWCFWLSVPRSLHSPSLKVFSSDRNSFPVYTISCLCVELVSTWLISDLLASCCGCMWVWEKPWASLRRAQNRDAVTSEPRRTMTELPKCRIFLLICIFLTSQTCQNAAYFFRRSCLDTVNIYWTKA